MISVIVPVYKVEAYLSRCVDSIRNQTYRDFLLILVDDGSPDNCGNLCDAYARQDSRIQVIHQKNQGLSAARNAGLDWMMANRPCEWITFVDSDDWIHPRTLEVLLDAAQSRNSNIAICGYGETFQENPAVLPEQLVPESWQPEAFYQERYVNATVAWGKLYHSSCFAQTRYPVGKLHEDEFVTYRLLFAQDRLAVVRAPLYAYFVNPAGITKRPWTAKRLDAWQAYEEQIRFFEDRGQEEMRRYRYRHYIENAWAQLQAAQSAPNAPELKGDIARIKKQMRSIFRRAGKLGYVNFWIDFEMLCACAPLGTRLYRAWLEVKNFRK